MRAFEKHPAGLGYSTVIPCFDIEAFSEAGFVYSEKEHKFKSIVNSAPFGLGAVGAPAYAEHPSTEILKVSWNLFDGAGFKIWNYYEGGRPEELCAYIENGGILECTNYMYEFWVWNTVCHKRMGWPVIPLSQLRDVAAKARNWSISPSLEKFTKILNTDVKKDEKGKSLIKFFTHPICDKKWFRKYPHEYPKENLEFSEYNIDDVVSQSQASIKMPDLSKEELELWYYSEIINLRGAPVNTEKIEKCTKIISQAEKRYIDELNRITLGYLKSVSENKKMLTFLAIFGLILPNLQAETVSETLKRDDLPPICRRILEIRKLMGSASVKKLGALKRMMTSDGRIHGLFIYQGADRSGRYSGKGPQAHNIPGGGPPVKVCIACNAYFGAHWGTCPHCGCTALKPRKWCHKAVKWAWKAIYTESLSRVEYFFGDAVKTVSGCLRSIYEAKEGNRFICSDYSAIEAVVLAMLAGEKWREEVFRTTGMIYEESASRITGVPMQEFIEYKRVNDEHHPLRKDVGKVAELASGYQGWVNAWYRFGAGKFFKDEKQLVKAILKWRAENSNIVEFWGGQIRGRNRDNCYYERYGIEGAAINAIQYPGNVYTCRGIKFLVKDGILNIKLPSGRCLYYHKVSLRPATHVFYDKPIWQICYWGHNTDSTKGPIGWIPMESYGGKLVENITQAVAREILAYAIVNLEKAGYKVVMHVHDEIIVEMPWGVGSIQEVEKILSTLPPWAYNWPIFARGGWEGVDFRKE